MKLPSLSSGAQKLLFQIYDLSKRQSREVVLMKGNTHTGSRYVLLHRQGPPQAQAHRIAANGDEGDIADLLAAGLLMRLQAGTSEHYRITELGKETAAELQSRENRDEFTRLAEGQAIGTTQPPPAAALQPLKPLEKPKPIEQTITPTASPRVFIGHGRAYDWFALDRFLTKELKLETLEFNSDPVAGYTTPERLQEMLDSASFAFLIMTAEDEHADGTKHARENVIHEIGLFQGKLGLRKAIVLVEHGCSEFSNFGGVTTIRFHKAGIDGTFEKVRQTLRREKIIP